VVVSKELYTKQRKVGEFFVLRWGDPVNLYVNVCQYLCDDDVTVFCMDLPRGREYMFNDRMWAEMVRTLQPCPSAFSHTNQLGMDPLQVA